VEETVIGRIRLTQLQTGVLLLAFMGKDVYEGRPFSPVMQSRQKTVRSLLRIGLLDDQLRITPEGIASITPAVVPPDDKRCISIIGQRNKRCIGQRAEGSERCPFHTRTVAGRVGHMRNQVRAKEHRERQRACHRYEPPAPVAAFLNDPTLLPKRPPGMK
jgi:hypothetical protein